MSFAKNPSDRNSSVNPDKSLIVEVEPEPEPGLIDPVKADKVYLDIKQGRHKGVGICAAATLFISHLPFVFIFFIYLIKRTNANNYLHSFFLGEPEKYTMYLILCTTIFFLIMISVTAYTPLGRKGLGYFLYIINLMCLTFLIVWGFNNQSQGRYWFNNDAILLFFACSFFNASLAHFITACMAERRVRSDISAAIAGGLLLVEILILWLGVRLTFRPVWEYGIYLTFTCVLAFYYSRDFEQMVKKRGTLYFTNDWFLMYVHLQTDMFCRFWYYLFKKPDGVSDMSAQLAGPSAGTIEV